MTVRDRRVSGVRTVSRGNGTRMLESALVAFTTYFATIGPPDVAMIFAALTSGDTPAERLRYAWRAIAISAGILLFFALFGHSLLDAFGITLPALRTAGGLLLFLISIDLVFARTSGGVSTTSEETAEAATRQDISVFPLATPLIAGPGAIAATIVLMADARHGATGHAIVIGAMLLVLAITWVLMLVANTVRRVLGITGIHVISRVLGLLLAALAVQFVFDGIAASPIVHPAPSVL